MIELLAPEKYEVEIEDTIFVLRELDRAERAKIYQDYAGYDGKKIPDEKNYKLAFELVDLCLEDWMGVVDKKTQKEIPFQKELIQWLPDIVIARIANSILSKMRERIEQETEVLKNLKPTLDALN